MLARKFFRLHKNNNVIKTFSIYYIKKSTDSQGIYKFTWITDKVYSGVAIVPTDFLEETNGVFTFAALKAEILFGQPQMQVQVLSTTMMALIQ